LRLSYLTICQLLLIVVTSWLTVTPVVAWEYVGGQMAAGFWWLCRWLGFDQVRSLDSGWQA